MTINIKKTLKTKLSKVKNKRVIQKNKSLVDAE